MKSFIPVPYEEELKAALAAMDIPPTITPDMISTLRAGQVLIPTAEIVGDRAVEWEELDIPGANGNLMRTTIFRPRDVSTPTAGIVHTHGGGMIFGDRFTSSGIYLDWVSELRATVVTFDYRLAPENPHPAPVEDCYAALLWVADHVEELGIDPERLAIAGASAGGGLAAGVALMARDFGGPKLAAQILLYPMLDDRNETESSYQNVERGVWDRRSNSTGWHALLGDNCGGPDVSHYAAPGRAEDLSNLPPACIDVGSAEVFLDEDVDYALRIWHAGGAAELHVWPGAFHGFDDIVPDAELSRTACRTRNEWIRRTLDL